MFLRAQAVHEAHATRPGTRVKTRLGLARTALDAGEPEAARGWLVPALEELERDGSTVRAARVHDLMARALAADPARRTEALSHARQAEDLYEAAAASPETAASDRVDDALERMRRWHRQAAHR